MRLWHERLITKLPRQQLLGQHRECCALRGNGWGKKHQTVNYVFDVSPYYLYGYHLLVMNEMERRGYHPNQIWYDKNYRGQKCASYSNLAIESLSVPIYSKHDADYLEECLTNLKGKGIDLSI
ncbi:TIGR02328 family protein [Vagococcus sp.]|uniref:TIGR02328 family protein n=1 Tax=Vagococcus sp. TaxID=1933889 RepID=UPI003F9E0BEE